MVDHCVFCIILSLYTSDKFVALIDCDLIVSTAKKKPVQQLRKYKALSMSLVRVLHGVSEDTALDMFYKSSTAESYCDDETGLFGQSALYVFSLFEEEFSGNVLLK